MTMSLLIMLMPLITLALSHGVPTVYNDLKNHFANKGATNEKTNAKAPFQTDAQSNKS